jgi:hypothetical protein
MASGTVFQQALHTRHLALSVIDDLRRALRLAGEFPPPLGEVQCRIVEQTAPAPRKFDPPLILWTFRNHSGFLVLDGTYAHESASERRFPLADGKYVVAVRGEYYQEGRFDLAWPPGGNQTRVPVDAAGDPLNVPLFPGAAYPLPDVTTARLQLGPTILRGSLYTSRGDPIRDVLVEVVNLPFLNPPELPPLGAWPFLQTRTNDRGDWALVLPGRRYIDNIAEIPAAGSPPITKQFTFNIHYVAGAPPTVVPRTFALGREHSLRNTALRGQVMGPGGRPISGAQITTSVSPATSVSRNNGVWFLYFDFDEFAPGTVTAVTVTATTPDGSTASDSSARIKADATVVVPTFRFP